MQPTNNAVRRDASPLECSGDFCHGLLWLPFAGRVDLDAVPLLWRHRTGAAATHTHLRRLEEPREPSKLPVPKLRAHRQRRRQRQRRPEHPGRGRQHSQGADRRVRGREQPEAQRSRCRTEYRAAGAISPPRNADPVRKDTPRGALEAPTRPRITAETHEYRPDPKTQEFRPNGQISRGSTTGQKQPSRRTQPRQPRHTRSCAAKDALQATPARRKPSRTNQPKNGKARDKEKKRAPSKKTPDRTRSGLQHARE